MEIQQSNQLSKKERKELRRQEKQGEQKHKARIKSLKRAGFWFVALLGIGGLIFGFTKFSNQPRTEQEILPVDTVSPSDWSKGNQEAKVILIEYSDFQCPACGTYYPVIRELFQEFNKDIVFVYRHFPLRNIHPNADLAARAAEAAGRQGKFWEMHDLIFEHQKEWADRKDAREVFLQYAQSLNLDREQFLVDVDSSEIKDKIDIDYKSGLNFKVNATPTFFLNGEKLQNPRNYEEFKSLIQAAISRQ